MIVISCIVCLVVIGLVIIVLHVGEKSEDNKNKEKVIEFF